VKSYSVNRATRRARATPDTGSPVRPRTAGPAAVVALFSSLMLLLPPAVQPQGPAFVRRQGRKLVLGAGAPEIHLRGVNFNNHHWEEDPALILDSDHHSEIDFQRIAAMGMNAVRFHLSYRVFEDDDEPFVYRPEGWAWLDRNVAWAKRWDLRLIVDMHVPQGGYQGGTTAATTASIPIRAAALTRRLRRPQSRLPGSNIPAPGRPPLL